MKNTTVFKRLLGYLKAYCLPLFFVLLAAVISTGFMVMAPFLVGKVTTTLFASIADGTFYWETILWLLAALVALYLISQLFAFLQGFGMAKITANVMQSLRREINEKMHRLKLDYYDTHTHGDILSVITNDVDTINNTISQNLTSVVTQVTTAIGVLVMMFTISPALSLIPIVMVPLSLFSAAGVMKASEKYYGQQQELLGKLNITATENGVQITSGDADGSAASQTGTVTTGGSNLNVRTGAGTENPAITQLPNGTQVEVIGTEGGWYKIRLPEREGYVCGDYLTVSETAGGDGSFSLSLTEEETSALLELFGGFSGSDALTPDGNLTLIDDIGSSSQAGKQFITVESKNGNVFYLIIDRDDDGEETVHFLNQVDEADLMALTEDGETQPAERCQAGAVNMDCELCDQDMTACVGPELEPEETETPEQEETEPEAEESSGLNPAVLLLVLVLVGGGGAFAYFKLVKNKPKTKGNDDLDDYDYGEDSEDADDTGEDEIWETEDGDPDEDDPDAGGGGDEESETPVK